MTAKYAPIRTALEGQVSQRAFLPDKLKAEFDCLGAVSAPEEERRRRFRPICEQMIKFRVDSGSIYDLLPCLRSDYLAAEGVASLRRHVRLVVLREAPPSPSPSRTS